MSCLMSNQKTMNSVDFTTNCPKRRYTVEQLEKGIKFEDMDKEKRSCDYCYVEAKRDMNFNAKKVINTLEYNNEIKRMKAEKVEELNKLGGLRLFSFGDYMEENDNDIRSFLLDAREKGLKIKVITKQLAFIDKFYKEFEDVFSIIHISIDNIGCGVNWEKARIYRELYTKVIIRSVILKEEDIDIMEKLSDVMTFNHENIKNKVPNSINFKLRKKRLEELKEEFSSKMCCISGNCSTCTIKCKATNV